MLLVTWQGIHMTQQAWCEQVTEFYFRVFRVNEFEFKYLFFKRIYIIMLRS